ncbi:MAG TPA: hypothetical protein VEQ37_12285 [Actinomycetota bacterium]|nr:hypothetical protein [Actinomycetota bacterium]
MTEWTDDLTEWDVSFELATVSKTEPFGEEVASRLLTELEKVSGVVSVAPRLLAIDVTVSAADYWDAVAEATHWVRTSLEAAGLRPDLPVERVEARTAERAERDLDVPTYPDLVGVAEVADLLGVSKQRVSELRDSPRFPAPVSDLRSGPVWTRAAIERFVESWERKPGRPSRARA